MENLGGNRFNGIHNAVRKRRTQTSRRPPPPSESQAVIENRNLSSMSSSTPPSDDVDNVSSEDNAGSNGNPRGKEIYLNQCISTIPLAEGETPRKRSKKEDGGFSAFYNTESARSGLQNKRSSEGVLAPASWKSASKVKEGGIVSEVVKSAGVDNGRNSEMQNSGQVGLSKDGLANENKVKKVKLKVGGVTRTIHANTQGNGVVLGDGSSAKISRSSDELWQKHNQNLQGNSDTVRSPLDKRAGLQGIPWKDFSRGGFSFGKEDLSMSKPSGKNIRSSDQNGSGRKSKRPPRRRVVHDEFGDDDDDDEIRYLEKLKTIAVYNKEGDEESGEKQGKLRVSDMENIGTSKSGIDGKKSRSDRTSGDTDFGEEDEVVSDTELEGRKEKQWKESVDSLMGNNREMTLTTRQRALQSSKNPSSSPGSSKIEFPDGLPPAPPRKQKEKLTEVEQQLKKTEAAQRRRVQVEKAARESEAEAIRKILGQDSTRKKREDKMKKRREEMAQERATNDQMLASNTIRVVMGPNGTTVTFPNEMGLPSIFNSKPVSYPPPREICGIPLCNNPFKYRHSVTNLPLCSFECYKAMQKQQQASAESTS